jgi:hypothetical protein
MYLLCQLELILAAKKLLALVEHSLVVSIFILYVFDALLCVQAVVYGNYQALSCHRSC